MTRAASITADRRIAVTDYQPGSPGTDEVTVEVAYCGLCGSDLHLFFDTPDPAAGHVLGHEFSGTVTAVGAGVTDWSVGDRVVIRPIGECGQCRACTTEDGVCLIGLASGPGLGRVGGLAQAVTVPAAMLHRVPESLSLRDAALTEPFAVVIRAVHRAGLADGDAVVVIGAGPIGLLAVAALHARGIGPVLVVEPNPERRGFAERLGARTATPETAGTVGRQLFPDGAHAVIECSGHPSAAQQAVNLLGYQGTVVVVGICPTASELQLTALAVNEITITGSTAYCSRDFQEALEQLAGGRVDTAALITSVIELDEVDAKLRDLASGQSHDVKVLVGHTGR